MSSEPQTWKEVKILIEEGRLEKLTRTLQCTTLYRAFKKDLADSNITITEKILQKLDWSSEELTADCDGQNTDELIQMAFNTQESYKITVNEFPYNFEDNMQHLLIWSKSYLPIYTEGNAKNKETPPKNKLMMDKIQKFINQNMLVKYKIHSNDFMWFVNHFSLQSVRSVSHIHLVIRTKDEHLKSKILANGFDPMN